MQTEYNKLKSSEKRFSDELKMLQQKYDNLCAEFEKKTFIHEAEEKMEQLQNTLADSISEFKKLALYTQDKVCILLYIYVSSSLTKPFVCSSIILTYKHMTISDSNYEFPSVCCRFYLVCHVVQSWGSQCSYSTLTSLSA